MSRGSSLDANSPVAERRDPDQPSMSTGPGAPPIRVGVLASRTLPTRDWVGRARTIETLGYSTLLAPDHFGGRLSPFPALAAAAAGTGTLRLGTLVVNVPVWGIAQLARDVATVHLLADGRFELGVGAGWSTQDERATGTAERSSGERRRIFEARLAQLTTLLAGGRIRSPSVGRSRPSFALDLPGLERLPPPRLVIGATGLPLITHAAQIADTIVLGARPQPSGVDAPESASDIALTQRVQWVRSATERQVELGLPIRRIEIMSYRQAGRELAPARPTGASARPDHLVGSRDGIVRAIRELHARSGISYLIIPESAASRFAPVLRDLVADA
jgi:probable F420-dependent oxidoreductase